MGQEVVDVALNAEKLGIIGLLLLVLIAAVWVIRFLYKEKIECEKDRLKNSIDIGELKGDVRALNAEVKEQQKAREEQQAAREAHKEEMRSLHHDVLIAIARQGARESD